MGVTSLQYSPSVIYRFTPEKVALNQKFGKIGKAVKRYNRKWMEIIVETTG
jgi:hypothetical protein